VVAYDVQNMGVKYIKHLNVEQGLEMLKNYQYNIDEIAKNIRINVRRGSSISMKIIEVRWRGTHITQCLCRRECQGLQIKILPRFREKAHPRK